MHRINQVATGANPISVRFGSFEVTEITSGETGGDEFIKLIQPAVAPDPSLIGIRHTLSLKTQADPADQIKVQIYNHDGSVPQAMVVKDAAGNTLAAMDDGLGVLAYHGQFLSFVWDGLHIVLDDRARYNENPVLPQYMPSPVGQPEGAALKIVGGVPIWVAS